MRYSLGPKASVMGAFWYPLKRFAILCKNKVLTNPPPFANIPL